MAASTGSRGGKVVGQSGAGRPIYASHLNSLGKMAHATSIAATKEAPAGHAVFKVTHGHDGAPVAPPAPAKGARKKPR